MWQVRLNYVHTSLLVDPERKSSDVAFLQYTSGSTADPKGVKVTHLNLVAQVHATSVQHVFGSRNFGLPLRTDSGCRNRTGTYLFVSCASTVQITLLAERIIGIFGHSNQLNCVRRRGFIS
jgi:acyl-CoA synthetase (AMP-forming)/AMP-acid ligase II